MMGKGKNGEYDGFTDYLDTMNRCSRILLWDTLALGIAVLIVGVMYYCGFFNHDTTLEQVDSYLTLMMLAAVFCGWLLMITLSLMNERFKQMRAIRRILTEKMDGFEEYLEDERYWKNVWERRGKE